MLIQRRKIPMSDKDLSPEAILARATAARGDIFPEWKPIAYALPQTYDLINRTGSYLHQYHGQRPEEQALSGPMRELIAIPALCAKGDMRHAPNHVRRIYRMGVTNKAILEAASAFATVVGWSSMTFVSLAILEANSPEYPYGKLPEGGEPEDLTPFPELEQGRSRKSKGNESLLDTPEWRYAAGMDAELARRCAAFVDHCLLAGGAESQLLGPGPRELIAIAALCTRGEVELAAQHIRRAYDYGMSKRQVLEAIACVLPMSGMVTGQLGLRAMRLADAGAKAFNARAAGSPRLEGAIRGARRNRKASTRRTPTRREK
jgi:alkylhydroperoxidase/carboxymuconolactone decarboxylase family protein YurZ